MLHDEHDFELPGSAQLFSALGDPVRLSIVRRLCERGPSLTVELKKGAGGVSRQGITKHLRVLEVAGLVTSTRLGRDRQWQLHSQKITALREYLDTISAQWDARLERLRALIEDDS
jgi:DNA-binding transcriptional ArsR family regulator